MKSVFGVPASGRGGAWKAVMIRRFSSVMVRRGTGWREAAAAALPPGFDADCYLEVNTDVAAACTTPEAAARHFLSHGAGEMRRVFPEGTGIHDAAASRLLQSARDRRGWRDWLCKQSGGRLDADFLRRHPRAAWLDTGFALASYLAQNPDVACEVDDPLEAAFHFLEFGLEDGRYGRPRSWDAAWLKMRYGLTPEPSLGVDAVRAILHGRGVDPFEVTFDEGEHWHLRGSDARMARFFDHGFYFAAAAAAGLQPGDPGRYGCIEHFCRSGCQAALPVAAGHELDPAHYRGQARARQTERRADMDAVDALADGDLYRHWVFRGIGEGLFPNIRVWAKHEFDLEVPDWLTEVLAGYRRAAPDLSQADPDTDILRHLLNSPMPALAGVDIGGHPDAADFITLLGDRQVRARDYVQGEWLYWLALEIDPANSLALRHLADLLQRQGRTAAVGFLRGRVSERSDSGWNALLLCEILFQQGAWHRALQVLDTLPESVEGDVALRRKRRKLARDIFHHLWSNITAHAEAHGVAQAQADLREALAACTPRFTSVACCGIVRRVALIGNEDLVQCRLYRVEQKAEQLRAAGYKVSVFSPSRDLANFRARLEDFDAVIFFRVAAFPEMIETIAAAAQRGLLTFYEIDDLVFDADQFPPALETYAGQVDAEHHRAMACGVPLFEHAMGLCDHGIASTETLRAMMAERVRSGRAFVHRNALGRLHRVAIRDNAPRRAARGETGGQRVVIFYGSGTRAHKQDFHEILEPALAHIARTWPDRVEIRLIGHFGQFLHLDPGRDPVTVIEPVWNFEDFCAHLADADINLSVLSSSPLTDVKSEIKWLEAAMLGIPSIVSATATHRDAIMNGETGMLCETTEDFISAIDGLVRDPDLRTRIGATAREVVTGAYSLTSMGRNLVSIFAALCPAKPRKPRLLVVNVFYPPQAIGGATRVVHDHVTLLGKSFGDRYDIEVVCTLEGGTKPYEILTYTRDGVRVWSVTPSPDIDDMCASDPRMGGIFEELLERIGPDLVHFHCVQRLTATVVEATRLAGIPYLITVHDGWWISPNQFVVDNQGEPALYDYAHLNDSGTPERPRTLHRALSGAQRIIAVSESFAALHRSCHVKDVVTIENGVSFLPEVERSAAPDHRIRLAHIGGATVHKGFTLLRNTLLTNEYENLRLLVVDHSLAPGTTRHTVWGTTPVTIQGKVPQSQVDRLYGAIDILVAPSVWPESYGLVAREAHAAGAWVIASDRGAIGGDVVEGQNGHVVDVSTHLALADILRKVDADPGRYRKSPAMRPKMRTAQDQVDALAQLYAEVLESARPGRGA